MDISELASRMGAVLRLEVERQLLADLANYQAEETEALSIDWSNPCEEGHCTRFLDGILESMSDVVVIDSHGRMIAEGWFDFVHGGNELPLHIFWIYLNLIENGESKEVELDSDIPLHVWARLSRESRDSLTVQGKYDSSWSKDQKVKAWRSMQDSPRID